MWTKFKNIMLGQDVDDDEEYYEEEYENSYEDEQEQYIAPQRVFGRGQQESRPRGSASSGSRRQNHGMRLYESENSYSSTVDNVTHIVRTQIIMCHPKEIQDARQIISNTKKNMISIVTLTDVEPQLSQRIADFLSGAIDALDGEILRLNKDMFLTAPDGVDISNPEVEKELKSQGITFSAMNW